MRNVTDHEIHQLQAGHCPACFGTQFQPGPRGGASQNFECVSCGSRFNLTIVGRDLLLGQVIDRDSDWEAYYETFKPRALFA